MPRTAEFTPDWSRRRHAPCGNASRRGNSTPETPRPVPRVVRLASQARGKAKLFEELASGYARLAQAAGPGGEIADRARSAVAEKKAFEVELEALVARIEIAIQTYSRLAGSPEDSGPRTLVLRSPADPVPTAIPPTPET